GSLQPRYGCGLATIMKEIPEALFVHIIRDGCDIALSLRKLGDFNPFPWSRRPAALPPVAANGTVHASPVARCLSPPRQRNLVFHCRQKAHRTRLLIHESKSRNTEGVSQKPK